MPRVRKKFLLACTLVCSALYLFKFMFHQNDQATTGKQANSVARIQISDDKDQRFIVYNRVPKCGSMSMTTLCYRLGGANGFKVASPYEDGERPTKTEEQQKEFIKFLVNQPPGFVYIRHQYFIDFTEFGEKQPLYINLIRDPIARFESFYYFSRFGNELGGGASAKMSDVRRQESIDECVQKRRQECLKPYWQVVPYFCGQHPRCMSRSKWALDKAKENIERHYAFVGTIEELETSLKILENTLPQYFTHASSLYHNPENDRMKHETSTRKKLKTSQATKDFLRSETCLKLEYELYDFVTARLQVLKQSVL